MPKIKMVLIDYCGFFFFCQICQIVCQIQNFSLFTFNFQLSTFNFQLLFVPLPLLKENDCDVKKIEDTV